MDANQINLQNPGKLSGWVGFYDVLALIIYTTGYLLSLKYSDHEYSQYIIGSFQIAAFILLFYAHNRYGKIIRFSLGAIVIYVLSYTLLLSTVKILYFISSVFFTFVLHVVAIRVFLFWTDVITFIFLPIGIMLLFEGVTSGIRHKSFSSFFAPLRPALCDKLFSVLFILLLLITFPLKYSLLWCDFLLHNFTTKNLIVITFTMQTALSFAVITAYVRTPYRFRTADFYATGGFRRLT